jgi:hypothetical protein
MTWRHGGCISEVSGDTQILEMLNLIDVVGSLGPLWVLNVLWYVLSLSYYHIHHFTLHLRAA